MSNPKRLVLVDGSSLIYRAYFAVPANLATSHGLHTNAIFGFTSMFRKLFAGRKPDFGAVIFDSKGQTFRELKYPQYKAQRPELPADLGEQLPYIPKVVDAHGFKRFSVEGYEADDVIGTLTLRAVAAGMQVIIVSGDKDFAQLISESVCMVDTLRDITYDPPLVMKKWGVKPTQMVDLLALMGDASDNIPGVTGIGQKGAAGLLDRYGSLASVLEHVGELKGRQKTNLETERDIALLSQQLATIDCAVPLETTLEELAVVMPEAESLNALYRELEFYSLLTKETRTEETAAAPAACRLCLTLADVSASLAALRTDVPVAIVPIFDLPTPITGALVGLAFSTTEKDAFYVPLSSEQGLGDAGLALLKPLLEEELRKKIVHNVKELWLLCERNRVALRGVLGDTMLASFLIEPAKLVPHRLDQVVREYLHRPLSPIKEVTGAGQKELPLHAIDPAKLLPYAAEQVQAVRELWPVLSKKLAELDQTKLLETHELPLAFVLGRMELDGIKVDGADLKKVGEELTRKMQGIEKVIYELAGHAFNIGSTKQLATVLFEELRLPVIKRTKTGYSTDSDVLERLAPKHAIAMQLVEHRKVAKLINTYTDVLQKAVNPRTGRVHATLQQTTGVSGRLISTDPDLQRTPIKTPEGKRIREAFIADPGNMLISADWSQIELRVLAHISKDDLLVDSFRKGADVHRRTASQIFGIEEKEVTAAQRGVGKTVNFATIYGQGATALGQILGIPREEAQRYIEGYFKAYAGVTEWLAETIEEAHARGYVTTLLGRRRYIPELSSRTENEKQAGERIAANTPIQGSAADLCKLAMLQIANNLRAQGLKTRMLMQIHDELVFEAPEGELAAAEKIIRQAMEHAFPLDVPLVVEIGVGKSWAEAH